MPPQGVKWVCAFCVLNYGIATEADPNEPCPKCGHMVNENYWLKMTEAQKRQHQKAKGGR